MSTVTMDGLNAHANTVPTLPYADLDKFILQQTRLGTPYTLEGTIRDLSVTVRNLAGTWDATQVMGPATLEAGETTTPFTATGRADTSLYPSINYNGAAIFNAAIGNQGLSGLQTQFVAVQPAMVNVTGLQEYVYGVLLVSTTAYDFYINGAPGQGILFDHANPSLGLYLLTRPSNAVWIIDAAYTPGMPFIVVVNPADLTFSVITPNGTFPCTGAHVPSEAKAHLLGLIQSNNSTAYNYSLVVSTDPNTLFGLTLPNPNYVGWLAISDAPLPAGAYDTQRFEVVSGGPFVSARWGNTTLKVHDIVTIRDNATDIDIERFTSDTDLLSILTNSLVPTLSQFRYQVPYTWTGNVGDAPTQVSQGIYPLLTQLLWRNVNDPVDTGDHSMLYRHAPAGAALYCTTAGQGFSVLSSGVEPSVRPIHEGATEGVHDVSAPGNLWDITQHAAMMDPYAVTGQFEFIVRGASLDSLAAPGVAGIYLPFDANGCAVDAATFATGAPLNVLGVLAASPCFVYVDLSGGSLVLNDGSGTATIITSGITFGVLPVGARITFIVSSDVVWVYLGQTLLGTVTIATGVNRGGVGFTYFQSGSGVGMFCNTGQVPFAYGSIWMGSPGGVYPVERFVGNPLGRLGVGVTNGSDVNQIVTHPWDGTVGVTVSGDDGRVYYVSRDTGGLGDGGETLLSIRNSGSTGVLTVGFNGWASVDHGGWSPQMGIPPGETQYYRLSTLVVDGDVTPVVAVLGRGNRVAPVQTTATQQGLVIDYKSQWDTYAWILDRDFDGSNQNGRGLALNGWPDRTVQVVVQQDGTGGHAFTWPTGWVFPGGIVPTVSQGANAIDAYTVIPLIAGVGSLAVPRMLVIPHQLFS